MFAFKDRATSKLLGVLGKTGQLIGDGGALTVVAGGVTGEECLLTRTLTLHIDGCIVTLSSNILHWSSLTVSVNSTRLKVRCSTTELAALVS